MLYTTVRTRSLSFSILALTTLIAGCGDCSQGGTFARNVVEMEVGAQGRIDPNASNASTCEVACDFSPGSTEQAGNLVLDTARLEQFGTFPYREPGTFTVHTQITNDSNQDLTLDAFSVVWKTTDGFVIYEVGETGSAGIRPVSVSIPAGETRGVEIDFLDGTSFPDRTNPEVTFLRGGLVSNFGNAVRTAPAQVIVEVQARGENARGRRVKSDIYSVPVQICDGCGVFDRIISSCCDNPDAPDTAGCPTFGTTPMCAL